MDANGDGVGDLAGILSRLDYLEWLGVDAIWLSPIYPSPMADFGYDVADYTGIDPLFGTLADFDRLVQTAHARGLKVILDFVPNHTSDQHPWFRESRRSRDNPKRDWYLWRDPAPDGGPPNNWLSLLRRQRLGVRRAHRPVLLSRVPPEQPDLNWRNPRVVEAMLDVLRFWLERGVDGFRVDVMWHLVKDDEFPRQPAESGLARRACDPYQALVPLHTTDRPEVHDIVARMRALLDEYRERVLIGEIYLPIERLVTYYGADLRGAHLPFNFQLIHAHVGRRSPRAPHPGVRGGACRRVPGRTGCSATTTSIASPAALGRAQARVAAMLLLTLRGTPTLYYGDEIGMHDVPIPAERVQDPFERNVPGLGLGRDPERTPMQWSPDPQAGFTRGEPWLPLASDYRDVNVAAQRDDAKSVLTLYRRLIALRRAEPALEVGRFELVETEGQVLAYIRRSRRGESDFLIALNLGAQSRRVTLPRSHASGALTLSTHLDRADERIGGAFDLRSDEGVIVRLS